jgi:hypothetical protein
MIRKSKLKKPATVALTAIALTVAPLAASAGSLQFDPTSAAWLNPIGGPTTDNTSPGLTASVDWGSGGTSGYDFTFSTPTGGSLGDALPNPAAHPGSVFDLGTFTHRNQPINPGTSITSIELDLLGDILVGGSSALTDALFSFDFLHNETPNNTTPCPGGDPTPCGDLVNIQLLDDTSTFTFGGLEYTLTIQGFKPILADGSIGELASEFFSDENANNSAILQASFTVAPIPLPAAGWMLLAGIGGLAAVRRKKAKAAA